MVRFLVIGLVSVVFLLCCGRNAGLEVRIPDPEDCPYLSTRANSIASKVILLPEQTNITYIANNRYVVTDFYSTDQYFMTIRLAKKDKGRFITLDSIHENTGFSVEEMRFPIFYKGTDLFTYRTSHEGSNSVDIATDFVFIRNNRFVRLGNLFTEAFAHDPETIPETAASYEVTNLRIKGDQLIVISTLENSFITEGENPNFVLIECLKDTTHYFIDTAKGKLCYLRSTNPLFAEHRWDDDANDFNSGELSWELFEAYFKEHLEQKPKNRF